MIKVAERKAKLAPKFVRPRLEVNNLHGHKFQILDPLLNTLDVLQTDSLKQTVIKPNLNLVDTAYLSKVTQLSNDQSVSTHDYNLCSRKQSFFYYFLFIYSRDFCHLVSPPSA